MVRISEPWNRYNAHGAIAAVYTAPPFARVGSNAHTVQALYDAAFAPVSSDELRAAIRDRLRDWADFARRTDDPEWGVHLGHKAYVVETMCRALCTLATGELQTKPQAVAWALATLPAPWTDLVERSHAWRGDPARDDSLNAEIRRFVLWAAARGGQARTPPDARP